MKRKQTKAKARGQFSDATRAQIFAWDRGVCALTGANLWMLDYGLSGLEQEDWADHIKPVARGGKHLPGNGVCASANANFTKGANGRANEFWFIGGRPTYRYFSDMGKVPEATARWLARDVQPSDWYFNRAVRNLCLAIGAHGYDVSGYKRHEDRLYYPKAALRFLKEFRDEWMSAATARRRFTRVAIERDWQARGLMLRKPWPEQSDILELLDLDDEESVARLAEALSRRYRQNSAWVEKMDDWTKSCDPAKGRAILSALAEDKAVSPLVRELVTHNIAVLSGLPKPVRGEGERETVRRAADYQ